MVRACRYIHSYLRDISVSSSNYIFSAFIHFSPSAPALSVSALNSPKRRIHHSKHTLIDVLKMVLIAGLIGIGLALEVAERRNANRRNNFHGAQGSHHSTYVLYLQRFRLIKL